MISNQGLRSSLERRREGVFSRDANNRSRILQRLERVQQQQAESLPPPTSQRERKLERSLQPLFLPRDITQKASENDERREQLAHRTSNAERRLEDLGQIRAETSSSPQQDLPDRSTSRPPRQRSSLLRQLNNDFERGNVPNYVQSLREKDRKLSQQTETSQQSVAEATSGGNENEAAEEEEYDSDATVVADGRTLFARQHERRTSGGAQASVPWVLRYDVVPSGFAQAFADDAPLRLRMRHNGHLAAREGVKRLENYQDNDKKLRGILESHNPPRVCDEFRALLPGQIAAREEALAEILPCPVREGDRSHLQRQHARVTHTKEAGSWTSSGVLLPSTTTLSGPAKGQARDAALPRSDDVRGFLDRTRALPSPQTNASIMSRLRAPPRAKQLSEPLGVIERPVGQAQRDSAPSQSNNIISRTDEAWEPYHRPSSVKFDTAAPRIHDIPLVNLDALDLRRPRQPVAMPPQGTQMVHLNPMRRRRDTLSDSSVGAKTTQN